MDSFPGSKSLDESMNSFSNPESHKSTNESDHFVPKKCKAVSMKNKNKGSKNKAFDYFKDLTSTVDAGFERFQLFDNASSKITIADSIVYNNTGNLSSSSNKVIEHVATNCNASSSSLTDDGEVRSRKSKNGKRKTKVMCDQDNCLPCSIRENCNNCYFCINRSKLRYFYIV